MNTKQEQGRIMTEEKKEKIEETAQPTSPEKKAVEKGADNRCGFNNECDRKRIATPLFVFIAICLIVLVSVGYSMLFPSSTASDDTLDGTNATEVESESVDISQYQGDKIGVYVRNDAHVDDVVEFLKTFKPDEIDATRSEAGFYLMTWDEPQSAIEINQIISKLSENVDMVKMTETSSHKFVDGGENIPNDE